jgi:hypothetical protein
MSRKIETGVIPALNYSEKFRLLSSEELRETTEDQFHVLKDGVICSTDYRARKRSALEIFLDATDGFIPVWAKGQVLRWRFNQASLSFFADPQAVRAHVRDVFNAGVGLWGTAAPIRFVENPDNSDFEIVVERRERCSPQGCTLARAFFPDAGRHDLLVFPTMFELSIEEQTETMAHEVGHIFGLRHFFAPELEADWPAVLFGERKPFSIMNYNEFSQMTDDDRNDLESFYQGVWNGQLTEINRTPIRQFRPFSSGLV